MENGVATLWKNYLQLSGKSSCKKQVRAKILNVSHAFHSRLMVEMETEFMEYVSRYNFARATIPIVLNCSAKSTQDPADILEDVRGQCTKSVMWHQTIERMLLAGVDCFVEVGTSKTLTGLIKGYHGDHISLSSDLVSTFGGTCALLKKSKKMEL